MLNLEEIKAREQAEMTIDEAIEHCKEVAASACPECAKEHEQLAEWLTELKSRRTQHEQDEQQIATLKKALELACNRLSIDGLCPATEGLSESICDNCNEDYCTNEVRTEEWSKYFIQQAQEGQK